ncbi:uncharacterized protein LODBEIA_P51360 [Lodderomyces beijingensis]|uniref:RRM domain-containing protein n=1 Tax=Lodderomyces beijingensis TaxID=1775926 RepID=A0ABP0ZU77_9ASCO
MARRVDYSVLRESSNSRDLSGTNNSSSSSSGSINMSTSEWEPQAIAKEKMNSLYSTAWESKRASTSSSMSSGGDGGGGAAEDNDKSVSPEKSTEHVAKPEQDESFVRGRPSACVFVASLRSSMADDDLCVAVTNHFKKWGSLTTVKVLRDTSNRPYAFVQYLTEEDSKIAIEMGHNSMLNGRSIRCEAAKVNRTLFFTSKSVLAESVIRAILDRFGEIEELVPSNSRGQIFTATAGSAACKGYRNWFCKFVYRDDAIKAFASLTEEGFYQIEWAQNVDKANPVAQFDDSDSKIEYKVKFDKFSVFVGQLSSTVKETDLRKRFERHGEILNLTLMKKATSTFAFIQFKDESSAAGSVEAENHSMLCGKTMHVQYREVRVRAPRKFSVALAPPPINLGKKSFGKNHDGGNKFFAGAKSRLNSFGANGFRARTGRVFKGKAEAENVSAVDDTAGRDSSQKIVWQTSQVDITNSDEMQPRVLRAPNLEQEFKPTMIKMGQSSSTEEGTGDAKKEVNKDVDFAHKEEKVTAAAAAAAAAVNSNYVAPPNSGFSLFYYVPAESVNFANPSSANSQSTFYGVYPPYYPQQSQFENVGMGGNGHGHGHGHGGGGGGNGSGNGSGGNGSAKNEFNSVGSVSQPANYGVPNFIYYSNDNADATRPNQNL